MFQVPLTTHTTLPTPMKCVAKIRGKRWISLPNCGIKEYRAWTETIRFSRHGTLLKGQNEKSLVFLIPHDFCKYLKQSWTLKIGLGKMVDMYINNFSAQFSLLETTKTSLNYLLNLRKKEYVLFKNAYTQVSGFYFATYTLANDSGILKIYAPNSGTSRRQRLKIRVFCGSRSELIIGQCAEGTAKVYHAFDIKL